jgi:hypothetical protein
LFYLILLGINNILHGDQPEEVKQQFLELTDLLKQNNAQAKIVRGLLNITNENRYVIRRKGKKYK